MKIWANTIVHNEENFVWFALMSVVDYVDKILVWDTGSTDKTVEIIKEAIKEQEDKIEFREMGSVDKNGFTKMRQAMLEQSYCDWILILDGDEIWWENSVKQIVSLINKEGNNIDAIVVPFYNVVGDIYHYQSQSAGEYKLLGRKGHLTLKAIRQRIPVLNWAGPYGQEGLYDGDNKPLQDRKDGLLFIDSPFLHFTHLKRSKVTHDSKFKYDLGIRFPVNFKYPEVFYKKSSLLVPSPWKKRSKRYEVISIVKKPLQSIWRKVKNK